MPRMRTQSSTPESRRRELLLLKSASINGRIQLAFEEAKSVVRTSLNNKRNVSHANEFVHADVFEVNDLLENTTVLPPIHHLSQTLTSIDDEIENKSHARVSSTTEEFLDKKLCESTSISSLYHVELASSDNENDDGQSHFITCFNIEPIYRHFYYNRRRTSSLPSSTITIDCLNTKNVDSNRSSSLVNLTLWHYNPKKIINLYNRQYHCQPISNFENNKFLLSNSTQMDVYNIETGVCEEKIRFQSSNINYIAVCYNKYKQQLLVASTTNLYVYSLTEHKVVCDVHLPGYPFNLDHNNQIRYLSCNSSNIYHGYFSFTSKCTSTVLSRLSQFELKHVCDLEFDDGTLHGLHAFENYVGIVIRYGRYSSKIREDYCLYIYDSLLDKEYYHIDLNDIGYITCLTGYENTLDWILCDSRKQRITFINQESVEYVQYDESINQCMISNETNHLIVWLSDRVFIYPIE